MNELALFAGAGGGILGGKLLGWRTVCAVEWEKYPACVLAARQNDGLLPPFPIWDDVQTFDGKPWRGIVDVVSGGFPCQDISIAGNGDGLDGERSGMWREMARIISEVRPKYIFVENFPMLTFRGLDTVLADLSKMGFDAEWGVMGANDVGANHKRDRVWIVGKMANTNIKPFDHFTNSKSNLKSVEQSREKTRVFNGSSSKENVANTKCLGWEKRASKFGKFTNQKTSNQLNNCGEAFKRYGKFEWWATEPNVGRVADGLAARMDRLKAIGNGQVPLCAATAWRLLNERL
jgi:DNA (cytosine-5)-methyltransferase 1